MFEVDLAQSRIVSSSGRGSVVSDGGGGRGGGDGAEKRFLVVVKEWPPSRKLNKTVRYILSNWTYLRWPLEAGPAREAFYHKLRHSILKTGGGGGEQSPRL